MKLLYDFNHQPELWGTINEEGKFIPPPSLSKDHPNAWNGKGGARARRALQVIYTIAFICLLRSDEVLKINRTHITYLDDGTDGIILTLPFRKTHQGGGELFHTPAFTHPYTAFFLSRDQAILSLSFARRGGPLVPC